MFTLSLVCATLLGGQWPESYGELRDQITNAHLIAVISVDEHLGRTRPPVRNADGSERAQRPHFVDTVRFHVRTTLVGDARGATLSLAESGGGRDTWYPRGTYLAMLYRQRPNGLIETGYGFMRVPSEDYWQLLHGDIFSLPERTYSVLGQSPHERYAGVLLQAYESAKDDQLVYRIGASAPRNLTHKVSPEFLSFYSQTLEPRLLGAAGTNLSKKGTIYGIAVGLKVQGSLERFRDFANELDRTLEPESDVWIRFPVPPETSQLLHLMTNARTVCLREAAIISLPREEELKDHIIARLTASHRRERWAALRWLNYLPIEGKPNLLQDSPWGNILNEEELIRYWRGG